MGISEHPHEATGEKPSYLLLGIDCRTPTEAAHLPLVEPVLTDVMDYRDALVHSLSLARELAATSIQKAQVRYKHYYDRSAKIVHYSVGDWVLVRFPGEETGRLRKLSRPWHGPYRVVAVAEPNVTVVKVYFPQEKQIQIHTLRVQPCPHNFPAGYFWYGGRRKGPGRPPKWVDTLLQSKQRDSGKWRDPEMQEENLESEEEQSVRSDDTEQDLEDEIGQVRDSTEDITSDSIKDTVFRSKRKRQLPSRYDQDYVLYGVRCSGRTSMDRRAM